mgnify:CR=1 FL=1
MNYREYTEKSVQITGIPLFEGEMNMNYKKKVIEMIEKMESVRFLAMIYSFTHTLFEKEKKQGD